jgi:hypothetical protein
MSLHSSRDLKEADTPLNARLWLDVLTSGRASNHIHILTCTQLVTTGHSNQTVRSAFLCSDTGIWALIYVWMYGIVVFCGDGALRLLVGHWPLVWFLTEIPEVIHGPKCGTKHPETHTAGNVADSACRTV